MESIESISCVSNIVLFVYNVASNIFIFIYTFDRIEHVTEAIESIVCVSNLIYTYNIILKILCYTYPCFCFCNVKVDIRSKRNVIESIESIACVSNIDTICI